VNSKAWRESTGRKGSKPEFFGVRRRHREARDVPRSRPGERAKPGRLLHRPEVQRRRFSMNFSIPIEIPRGQNEKEQGLEGGLVQSLGLERLAIAIA